MLDPSQGPKHVYPLSMRITRQKQLHLGGITCRPIGFPNGSPKVFQQKNEEKLEHKNWNQTIWEKGESKMPWKRYTERSLRCPSIFPESSLTPITHYDFNKLKQVWGFFDDVERGKASWILQ